MDPGGSTESVESRAESQGVDDANTSTSAKTAATQLAQLHADYARARDKIEIRNRIVALYLIRILAYHARVDKEVYLGNEIKTEMERIMIFGLDYYALGLSAAATAFTPIGTKTALSAAATFFAGAKTSFKENMIAERNSAIVLAGMHSMRQSVLQEITLNLGKDASAYSLERAKVDLVRLLYAGNPYSIIPTIAPQLPTSVPESRPAN